ncbi:hypothetical protein BK133_13135 [Paenibacillus sp. FSL H8-0548]|uniref:DUF2273 domain-containing protein n=1 Tax=Paenibacillus sp. FSL H8-0548 TaxID=1920422 RepID=UPI00096E72CF|nr:DUF2273 domain-containing protein [Paenibacillus sp. FSL H8-0548]OMF34256.1 hypothetical protein BK133_13135 [Paenibacillus sp. FSL H8-0548]
MWTEFWAIYGKRAAGAAIGLFFGFLYLFVGFWDMLFVALLVSIGYWIGLHKETNNGPILPWQRLWYSLLERFRPFK